MLEKKKKGDQFPILHQMTDLYNRDSEFTVR